MACSSHMEGTVICLTCGKQGFTSDNTWYTCTHPGHATPNKHVCSQCITPSNFCKRCSTLHSCKCEPDVYLSGTILCTLCNTRSCVHHACFNKMLGCCSSCQPARHPSITTVCRCCASTVLVLSTTQCLFCQMAVCVSCISCLNGACNACLGNIH